MNYKKIVFSSIVALMITIVLIKPRETKKIINPGIVEHFNLSDKTLNRLTSKNDLLAWLDQEEKAVWQSLEKTIGLSFNHCQMLKTNKRDDYEYDLNLLKNEFNSQEKLSSQTISTLQSIMKDFGINPSQLPIVACHHGSAAAATDGFIAVDEAIFNKLALNTKKFVIGHELIHFLRKDHSTNFFARKFAQKSFVNKNENNSPLYRLFQLQELRADILSSLQGSDYAQGSTLFFQDHIKAKGASSGPPCHPKSSLRLEIGQKIANFTTTQLT